MPNPFRINIAWYIDETLFPRCLTWQRGETPVERDAILFEEKINPKDGELTSEELADFLDEQVVKHNMVGYTGEQLKALARQIRKAESKVEVFAYDKLENPKTPWEHATNVNGTETPYNDRSGWIFRGTWKTKDGNSNPLRLWLTEIKCVEV